MDLINSVLEQQISDSNTQEDGESLKHRIWSTLQETRDTSSSVSQGTIDELYKLFTEHALSQT
jgi:hypothetical protein